MTNTEITRIVTIVQRINVQTIVQYIKPKWNINGMVMHNRAIDYISSILDTYSRLQYDFITDTRRKNLKNLLESSISGLKYILNAELFK